MSTPEPTPPGQGGPPATLEQRVAALEGETTQLGNALAELIRRTEPTTVRSWLTIDDPEVAHQMLGDLARWVTTVWERYPGRDPRLPDCWALHPWVVEELWVSMQVWLLAERKPGDYRVRDAWHDRSRPGVNRRLHESDDGHCEPDKHVPGALAGTPVTLPSLEAIAGQWATTRTLSEPTVRSGA